MQDPDQLSTPAYQMMLDAKRDRPTGIYVVAKREEDLLDLKGEGLVDAIDKVEDGYEAILNGNGLQMLKAMGVPA